MTIVTPSTLVELGPPIWVPLDRVTRKHGHRCRDRSVRITTLGPVVWSTPSYRIAFFGCGDVRGSAGAPIWGVEKAHADLSTFALRPVRAFIIAGSTRKSDVLLASFPVLRVVGLKKVG